MNQRFVTLNKTHKTQFYKEINPNKSKTSIYISNFYGTKNVTNHFSK